MRNLFLSLIGVTIFIVLVGLITKTERGETTILSPYLHFTLPGTTSTPSPTGLSNLKEIVIGKTKVMASIANTNSTRQKGLGGVASMPLDQGMLFVFDTKNITPDDARFWMKDMQIPLDFVWISNNKVSEVTVNVPAPAANTPDTKLVVYGPVKSIDYVLEVNAGFVMKNNIKIGDQVNNL